MATQKQKQTAYLDADLVAEIESLQREENRSFSQMVEVLLEEACRARLTERLDEEQAARA